MNWIPLLVGIVVLVAVFTAVGLVKSVLRMIIGLAVGVLVGWLTYWALQLLGLSETIPSAAILVPGAIAALSVLLGRR